MKRYDTNRILTQFVSTVTFSSVGKSVKNTAVQVDAHAQFNAAGT